MKKTPIILIILILLTSCKPTDKPTKPTGSTKPTEITQSTEEDEKDLIVADFFPKVENTKFSFLGEGNEYASYTVFIDYIFDNKLQYRKNNGGTELAEVIEIDSTKGMIKKLYLRGDFFYRDDFLVNTNLMIEDEKREEILLKEPIEVGNKWEVFDGLNREITGINVDILVPYGKFKAIEITTTEDDGSESIDYYVKGLGHVKYIFKMDGVETVSSSLEKVEKNTPLTQTINFYFPYLDEDKYYYFPTEVKFNTNDITRNIITNIYKTIPVEEISSKRLGPVFTKNTKINHMYLGKDKIVYLDLSKDFVTEMNAGAYYETMILQSVANTFGGYYGVEKVYLTIEGENYESGHILLKPGEYLRTDFTNIIGPEY